MEFSNGNGRAAATYVLLSLPEWPNAVPQQLLGTTSCKGSNTDVYSIFLEEVLADIVCSNIANIVCGFSMMRRQPISSKARNKPDASFGV